MKTVLVVDDSIFIRKTLTEILTENHFHVIGKAENGEEAVNIYKELKPDIVTMDITMPKKNGLDATKEILEFDPNASIVILSAISQKKFIIDSLRLGAKEFLFKPFNPELVVSTLNSL